MRAIQAGFRPAITVFRDCISASFAAMSSPYVRRSASFSSATRYTAELVSLQYGFIISTQPFNVFSFPVGGTGGAAFCTSDDTRTDRDRRATDTHTHTHSVRTEPFPEPASLALISSSDTLRMYSSAHTVSSERSPQLYKYIIKRVYLAVSTLPAACSAVTSLTP